MDSVTGKSPGPVKWEDALRRSTQNQPAGAAGSNAGGKTCRQLCLNKNLQVSRFLNIRQPQKCVHTVEDDIFSGSETATRMLHITEAEWRYVSAY